ncbi:MAG TPA: iron-sulfur cluster repair di-iron protein [Terriglobales bacterium]|nr:iron-sulfur cluster repair di-iron protein [Terriglobales bacterium]
MSQPLDAQRSLGELATSVPGAARVFERAGLDFCCGGKKSLHEACAAAGMNAEELLAELAAADPETPSDARWRERPLLDLVQHIVTRHHQYVREETPRIHRWLDKVVSAHGSRHPEVAEIRQGFESMAADLAQHMAKEELILFPAIARLDGPAAVGARPPAGGCGDVAHPVERMMQEHAHSGNDLAELRRLSGGYAPPPDACATFRALYQALADFERDLHQHIHLENNLLFPRALELERQHAGSRPA